MLKLPFKSKSKVSPVFLTADIGADAVKCLLVEIVMEGDSSICEIIGSGKVPLDPGMVRGGMIIDVENVTTALQQAAIEALNGSELKVKDLIIGLSGELCVCNMTTVKVTRGNPEPVSQKEISKLNDKIYSASLEETLNTVLQNTGSTEIDLDMITSSIVYSKMDGKVVPDLLGLTGQQVELAMFTAFTPVFNISIIQNLAKKAGFNLLAIGSEMYSLVSLLKKAKGEYFDGVIMDMGSDHTDVGVIFGGGVVASKTLPLGGTQFTKQIALKTGLSYNSAETKKLDYAANKLSDNESLSIQAAIGETLELWLDGVELLFEDFSGVKTYASTVYLVGGGIQLPDIVEILTKEPWTKAIPFKSPPEFIKLTVEDLPQIRDRVGLAESLEFLMPAALSVVYLELNDLL